VQVRQGVPLHLYSRSARQYSDPQCQVRVSRVGSAMSVTVLLTPRWSSDLRHRSELSGCASTRPGRSPIRAPLRWNMSGAFRVISLSPSGGGDIVAALIKLELRVARPRWLRMVLRHRLLAIQQLRLLLETCLGPRMGRFRIYAHGIPVQCGFCLRKVSPRRATDPDDRLVPFRF
jgi:hypothetical protein